MAEAALTQESPFRKWINRLWEAYSYEMTPSLEHAIALVEPSPSAQKSKFFVEHLAGLKLDEDCLEAALLYFPFRDGEIGPDDTSNGSAQRLLRALERFTTLESVALESTEFQQHSLQTQNETVRKMLISLIDDPRIAAMKLCERTVALRASNPNTKETRNLATEVQNFYSPLAARLGIWQIKWVMDDLAFRSLNADAYKKIVRELAQRRSERESLVEAIMNDLRWRLETNGVDCRVEGRAKSIYGIWQKMQEKGLTFNEVYDIQAVRVVVNSRLDCYRVLGIVHDSWPSHAPEFDDYIARPKDNGYQSIHTAVIGPRGRFLEVQIRTEEMNEQAEFGVCAHWRYKTGNRESLSMPKVDWLRSVLNWHEGLDPYAPAQPLFKGGDAKQIYLTTPQGHVVEMPQGSTPIDFAYRIHTEIGHHCSEAKVDGALTELDAVLQNGQRVEILTSPEAEPQRLWLQPGSQYITTTRAKEKAQMWFREHHGDTNAAAGLAQVEDVLDSLALDLTIDDLLTTSNYSDRVALCVDVSLGNCDVGDLVLDAMTAKDQSIEEFSLSLVAWDRPGLLFSVLNDLATREINVTSANVKTDSLGKGTIELALSLDDVYALISIMERLKRLSGIIKVRRGRVTQDMLAE